MTLGQGPLLLASLLNTVPRCTTPGSNVAVGQPVYGRRSSVTMTIQDLVGMMRKE
jgi:hypothetical protein